MDTHKATILERNENYFLVQYTGNKKKYVCRNCNKREKITRKGNEMVKFDVEEKITNPVKTFNKEIHIKQHLEDKHNIKIKGD